MELGALMQWLAEKWAMLEWGTVAQWLTALIAIGAFGAAVLSVRSQREIARKRAAFDFFIRTETDKEMLSAHKAFLKGIEVLKEHQSKNGTIEEFSKTDAYLDIRAYLT